METVCFSETMASTDESTRRQNPEHHQLGELLDMTAMGLLKVLIITKNNSVYNVQGYYQVPNYKIWFYRQKTRYRGILLSTYASYSGSPKFEFHP
jgi:hypothetical protein